MAEKGEIDLWLQSFKEAPLNSVMTLPIEIVKPSQKDDMERNESVEPVSGHLEKNFVLITHGNHRYWTRINRGYNDIRVKKTDNPYTNW